MGTSHHEPLMRAQPEWHRHGSGAWDYERNGETLREFWAGGLERTKGWEKIVTLGMRGDGDKPMGEEANVALLEKIVADQRKIIASRGRSRRHARPADVDALQGSAGVLRARHARARAT